MVRRLVEEQEIGVQEHAARASAGFIFQPPDRLQMGLLMSSSVNSISRSFSRIFSRPSGAGTGSWRQKSIVGVFASGAVDVVVDEAGAESFMSSSAPGKPASAPDEMARMSVDLPQPLWPRRP